MDIASVINFDGWRGYNGLDDFGYGHFRLAIEKDEFVRRRVHINGIEGFWGLAKVRLTKFKGVSEKTFHSHLTAIYTVKNVNGDLIIDLPIKQKSCYNS